MSLAPGAVLLSKPPMLCPSLVPESWLLGALKGCQATAWICPQVSVVPAASRAEPQHQCKY